MSLFAKLRGDIDSGGSGGRRRKVSPNPQQQQQQHHHHSRKGTTINATTRNSSSVEKRNRVFRSFSGEPTNRNSSSTSSSASTLLPTTFSSSPKVSPKFTGGGAAHNSFLFGGNYYAGKDKNSRQHLLYHHRSWWYRTFCSSSNKWRRLLLVAFFISFLCLLIIIVPRYFHVGRSRRGGTNRGWLLFDESLSGQLSSVEEERAEAMNIFEERQKLNFGSERRYNTRLQTIEQIVPGWYHRNDPAPELSKVIGERLKENNKQKLEDHDKDMISKSKKQNIHEKIQQNGQPSKENSHPVSKSSTHVVARTLHNMNSFHNMSACPSELSSTEIRTTLVMQATFDRLWILKETCERWKDPIILVVFVPNENDQIDISLTGGCPQLKVIRYIMDPQLGEDQRERYPVNRLRNIGLDAVQTSHVLMADVDFLPSRDLHMLIHSTLTERYLLRQKPTDEAGRLPPEEREAIVIPAFERIPPSEHCEGLDCSNNNNNFHHNMTSLQIPRSFQDLRACVFDRKQCRVFQSNNNWDGHSSTKSKAWMNGDWYDEEPEKLKSVNSTQPGKSLAHSRRIKTLKCFDSFRYEPYVVLRWCPTTDDTTERIPSEGPVSPYYDERFHGYGKNVSQAKFLFGRLRGWFLFFVFDNMRILTHIILPDRCRKFL